MARKKQRSKRYQKKIDLKGVDICKDGTYPTYKDVEILKKLLTERGKIIPRSRTGVSAKCQRHITQAIKHARHLALLPFIVTV